MANPQLEHGYLKIANELVKKFCSFRISGDEWLVLWVILKKTYGFNKKVDMIPLTQFAEETGLKRQNVHRALKKLSSKKIIGVIKSDDRSPLSYCLLKDCDKWKRVSSKVMTVIKSDDKTVINIDSKLSSILIPSKDNTKDNIKTISLQIENLQRLLNPYFNEIIKIYFGRNAEKNKTGKLSEGRKLTLLTEIINSKERCNNDDIFKYAIEQAINRDACNIGYINAIIKNKKTMRPR